MIACAGQSRALALGRGTRGVTGRVCLANPRLARSVELSTVVRAKNDDANDALKGILDTAGGFVDKAADLVPESVPRPAARAGVGIAGGLVIFWLINKVISGVITLVVIGGLGYYFLTKSDDGDGPSSKPPPKKSSGSAGKQDLDDPLAEAKRIMDKYK